MVITFRSVKLSMNGVFLREKEITTYNYNFEMLRERASQCFSVRGPVKETQRSFSDADLRV